MLLPIGNCYNTDIKIKLATIDNLSVGVIKPPYIQAKLCKKSPTLYFSIFSFRWRELEVTEGSFYVLSKS